jgi:hypothetical protein
MNGPAGTNSKAIMVRPYAGLTGRPVAVFNGVRHGGDAFPVQRNSLLCVYPYCA